MSSPRKRRRTVEGGAARAPAAALQRQPGPDPDPMSHPAARMQAEAEAGGSALYFQRKPSVVWYRGCDLRLEDHPALLAAAQRGGPVAPLFICERGRDERSRAKRWWLKRSLMSLAAELRALGVQLVLRVGAVEEELRRFVDDVGADAVFWNRCYEPELLRRDERLRAELAGDGLTAESFKAELLVEPWELENDGEMRANLRARGGGAAGGGGGTGGGTPAGFRTFHAYMRAWMTLPPPPQPFSSPSRVMAVEGAVTSLPIDELGLDTDADYSEAMGKLWIPGSVNAAHMLETFLHEVFPAFGEERCRRDFLGTSRLSPHIRFGELSPRRIYHAARVRVSRWDQTVHRSNVHAVDVATRASVAAEARANAAAQTADVAAEAAVRAEYDGDSAGEEEEEVLDEERRGADRAQFSMRTSAGDGDDGGVRGGSPPVSNEATAAHARARAKHASQKASVAAVVADAARATAVAAVAQQRADEENIADRRRREGQRAEAAVRASRLDGGGGDDGDANEAAAAAAAAAGEAAAAAVVSAGDARREEEQRWRLGVGGGIDPQQHFSYFQQLRQDGLNLAAVQPASANISLSARAFLKNICLRDFSYHVHFHHPDFNKRPLVEEFSSFPWAEDDGSSFEKWRCGGTGYPMVDAGMRQLEHTGWVHNSMRFLLASFLTKYLLLPWQRGLSEFHDLLIDGDQSSNALGWQWTSGSNTDSFPFSCLVNPVKCGIRQDPAGQYVRHWLPELRNLPNRFVHQPWKASPDVLAAAGIELGRDYPVRVIEACEARSRALDAMLFMRKIFASMRPSRGLASVPVENLLCDWPDDVPDPDEHLSALAGGSADTVTETRVDAGADAGAVGSGAVDPMGLSNAGVAAGEGVTQAEAPGMGMYYNRSGMTAGTAEHTGLASSQTAHNKASLLPSLWSLLHFDDPPSALPHASPNFDQLIAVDTACLADEALVLGTDGVTGNPSIENALIRAHVRSSDEDSAVVAQEIGTRRKEEDHLESPDDAVMAANVPAGAASIGGERKVSTTSMGDEDVDHLNHPIAQHMSGLPSTDAGGPEQHSDPAQSMVASATAFQLQAASGGSQVPQPDHAFFPGSGSGGQQLPPDHRGFSGGSQTGAGVEPNADVEAGNDQPGLGSTHSNGLMQFAPFGMGVAGGGVGPGEGGQGGSGDGAGGGAVDGVDGSLVGSNGMMPGLDPSAAVSAALYAQQMGFGSFPYGLTPANLQMMGGQGGGGQNMGFDMSNLTTQQQQHFAQVQAMMFGYNPNMYPPSTTGMGMDPAIGNVAGAAAAAGAGSNASMLLNEGVGSGNAAGYMGMPYGALGLGNPGYPSAAHPAYGPGQAQSSGLGALGATGIPDGGMLASGERGGGNGDTGGQFIGGKDRTLPGHAGDLLNPTSRVPHGVSHAGSDGEALSRPIGRPRASEKKKKSGGRGIDTVAPSTTPPATVRGRGKGRGRGRAVAGGSNGRGSGGKAVGGPSSKPAGRGVGLSSKATHDEAAMKSNAEPMGLAKRQEILDDVLRDETNEYFAFARYLTETYVLTENTDRANSKDYVRLCTLKDEFHKACKSDKDKLKIYKVKAFFSKVLQLEVTGEWDRHGHGGVRGPWCYGLILKQQ